MPVGGNSCANSADCQEGFYAWMLAKALKNAKRQSVLHHLIAPFNNTAITHIHVLTDVKVTQIAILENSATKAQIPVNLMAVFTQLDCEIGNLQYSNRNLYKDISIDALYVIQMIFISPTDGWCVSIYK